MRLEVYNTVDELSDEWDSLATSYFQKKAFLKHCEKHNPCSQRYYELHEETLISCAVVYDLPINILSYASKSLKVNANVIGIPASVSSSGVLGEWVLDYVNVREKGFTLGLNFKNRPDQQTVGHTLPTVLFNHKFDSWEDYTNSIRATYRRRVRKTLDKLNGIKIITSRCSMFTERYYQLYLNVFGNSDSKLEKLSKDFFKKLPKEFLLTTFKKDKDVIGWHITVREGDVLYFFLGGLDYDFNKEHALYLNLLINILQQGIRAGLTVDFGQTAEEAKCRLGGEVEERFMFASHTNSFFNFVINKLKSNLEYRCKVPELQVFK